MTEYLSPDHQEELMRICLETGDFTFASGKKGTVKFDFEKLDTKSRLFETVLKALTLCVKDNFGGKFDSIVSVANGATILCDGIAEELGMPHLMSSYTVDSNGIKNFLVHPESGVRYGELMGVDDVFSRGTNIEKVIEAAQGYDLGVIGEVVVLDRSGLEEPTTSSGLAVKSLMRRYLG